MTKFEAHTLLTAASNGALVSKHQITAALIVTGDLLPIARHVRQSVATEIQVPDSIPVWQVPAKLIPQGPRTVLPLPFAANGYIG
jgi:hypothetical protein